MPRWPRLVTTSCDILAYQSWLGQLDTGQQWTPSTGTCAGEGKGAENRVAQIYNKYIKYNI